MLPTYRELDGPTEIPTPENSLGRSSNMPRISNAELDATWAELNAAAIDDPARNELVIRVNDLISAESGGMIPLISRGSVSAIRQRDSRTPAGHSMVGTVNTGTSKNGPASKASSL